MLTRMVIRRFKRFSDVAVELGDRVVFVGPNNSGKSTGLQALALWEIGLKRWAEKRGGKDTPQKRSGVAINRRDLFAVPVPEARLLWRDLHVRDVTVQGKKQQTQNVCIDLIVDGVSDGRQWTCGLEFDYANEESFYCRPLRRSDVKNAGRMEIPKEALDIRVAFLQPMSGLSANETRLDPGAINVRLGEGRTAEVLRNLCHRIEQSDDGGRSWDALSERIYRLFGVRLDRPVYVPERGEIVMTYRDRSGIRLDLSCAGRGLHQTLLLLAHMSNNPRSILLFDEPDAHLEILRQRQIYEVLSNTARDHDCQLIIASHSEVILNEAADRDVVVAFVGAPHRIDDRGSQVLKSLKEIGFEAYYQAEQKGWVLYVEGSTDLAILRSFASVLAHPALGVLDRPFVHYVQNQPQRAREHFFGLREAKKDLQGFALFDHLDYDLPTDTPLREYMWQQYEIENYLCTRDVLRAWARDMGVRHGGGDLFAQRWCDLMDESIAEIEKALQTLGKGAPWTHRVKASDEFLDPLFEAFFRRLELPNLIRKTDYHTLAGYLRPEDMPEEIRGVLDAIHRVASSASPHAG
jgi:energy-coupling factor transporter ATP-binding protein EcfA2